MDSYRIPPKLDLTPRRHHGYAVLLFIMGTLLPPLGTSRPILPLSLRLTPLSAVAARFGIGKDFWINVLLTLCGYIPGMFILIHFTLSHRSTQGHGHNFYVQVRSLFPLLPLPSVTTGLVTEYP